MHNDVFCISLNKLCQLKMNLRPFQNEALKKIVDSYEADKKSAFLIMPAGTGKTILSFHVFKKMHKDYGFESMAYLTANKATISYLDSVLNENIDTSNTIVQLYTYQEISNLIKEKGIDRNVFQLLIFDDVDVIDNKTENLKIIFEYFEGFKVGFSRKDVGKNNSLAGFKNNGIIYKYSLNEAIIDGSYLSSQKLMYKHAFDNLNYKIKDIRIGEDWSNEIRTSLLNQLEIITNENSEYLKAQKILLSGKIGLAEIIELAHRKEQLEEFGKLLNDNNYFDLKTNLIKGQEAVWQEYFESNPWIFGFGLNYIFNSPLDGKKLEQTVEGYSITGGGKRSDALLQTNGLIQTLCFGEIKTHRKNILKETKQPYRPESWAVSGELAGGISQVQRTVQKSLKNITTALSLKDKDGFNSTNPIYLYKPKSFLIIGSLKEFMNSNGDINEDKFSSFELFRRSISDIEIITFDELYERANAIINRKWNNTGHNNSKK